MKCFQHPQADAVGSCKFCLKGVCSQCGKDTGIGLACSAPCESEIRSINALVERNKKVTANLPAMQSRSAIWLTMMALVFLGFGAYRASAYLIVFGIVMLCGAGFALINRRKIVRTSD
jgi:hypothetical protein